MSDGSKMDMPSSEGAVLVMGCRNGAAADSGCVRMGCKISVLQRGSHSLSTATVQVLQPDYCCLFVQCTCTDPIVRPECAIKKTKRGPSSLQTDQ